MTHGKWDIKLGGKRLGGDISGNEIVYASGVIIQSVPTHQNGINFLTILKFTNLIIN